MPRFRIAKGDESLKQNLFEILHLHGGNQGNLKNFLKSLGLNDTYKENWWVAIDNVKNTPTGALSSIQYQGVTYLLDIWNGSDKYEDQIEASRILLDAWISEKQRGVKIYQADISIFSPFTRMIEHAGFRKDRLLLAIYELDTDWVIQDLPDGYIMRSPDMDELGEIYDRLIEPEIEETSPVFISREQFMAFPVQLPKEALESWVVVENEKSKLVGFGASHLGQDDGDTLAILYGPHGTEAEVLKSIIAESLSFWKGHNIDKMRILRTSEYYDSIIRSFEEQNISMVNSTVRYILKKRR